MDPFIRAYRPEDTRPTWVCFDQAIVRTAAAYYTPEQIKAWNPGTVDLRQWNAKREAAWTVVAELDGFIGGFADLTAAGILDMLFVHPDVARKGVARALVTAVLVEASRRGLATVETHASRPARPALERLGFVVERENHQNIVRGEAVPNFDMLIQLPLR